MTAETFASLFVTAFKTRAAQEGARFPALWHTGGLPWTNLMVHSSDKSSVLEKTLYEWARGTRESVSLHHWYTIDVMAVSPAYEGDVEYWQCRPIALVEHENAKDVETEAWKLAYWRAPLKVLVFYRYGDTWFDAKLSAVKQIFTRAQSKCPETSTEYLLLIGCNNKQHVTWRSETWRTADHEWTSGSHETGVWIGD